MMITSGPAQMIIPGPETGHGYHAASWLLHNDDTATEIYVDVTGNIAATAGANHFVVPPGGQIALTGSQTFWARTRPGTTANLHIVPSATFGGTAGP